MITTSLLTFALLLGQTASPPPTKQAEAKQLLAEKVKRLVAELDDDSQARRDAAEKALVELGADVLDVLPAADSSASIELRARLGRVRTTVEKAYIEAFTKPAQVTLKGKMKLSQAIAAIEKQSGNVLLDAREEFNQEADNPDVTLDAENVSFWKALDLLLDQAGLTVYNYNDKPGQLRLISSSPGAEPRFEKAAYAGLFRIQATSLDASRDLRNPAASGLRIGTDIVWEPRVAPIVLTMPLTEIKAVDENDAAIAATGEGEVEVPIEPNNSGVEMELYLNLPERSSKKIASLKGTFTALVPGRQETFEFSKLDKIKNESLERGGVIVTLEQVRKNEDLIEVRLRVKFDEASNALESHRGWIDENPAFALDAKGNKIEPGGRERNLVAENEVGYSYLFDPAEVDPKTARFIYKTPAALFKVPVEFELKDLELP